MTGTAGGLSVVDPLRAPADLRKIAFNEINVLRTVRDSRGKGVTEIVIPLRCRRSRRAAK